MPKPENIKDKGFDKNPDHINKNGRPKGTKNRSTLLRYWLECEQKITNPITKEMEMLSVEDQVILALINKARKGDVSAIKEIMDSAYGKALQGLDITTGGDKINPPQQITPDQIDKIIDKL